MHNTVSALREFICFNQKQMIKYEFLISEMHKDLKSYFTALSKENTENNFEELKEKYESFVVDAFENLFNVLDENTQYIENIFKSLNKTSLPRITIKAISDSEVLNIYRNTIPSNFNRSAIIENTGFLNILRDNQLSFLENNLPLKFQEETYKNPRLNDDLREDFIQNKITWKDCWKVADNDEVLEYYSSTLIIPMSIRSEEKDMTDKSFYKHFFQDIQKHDASRTVWGFLCFDHTEVDFFQNEDHDDFQDIGYIIADILSLYLMFFYNHLPASKTINEIEKTLNIDS